MKVMHISKKYPQALGGDAVVVSNLCKQQQKAGHETVVVTSNCDEIVTAPQVYKFGLRDTPAQLDSITPKRILSLLMLFFQIYPILHRERPDVIHTHSVDIAFIVSAAAHLCHIPMIHTFHIVTFYDAAQSAFRRKIELWLAKRAKPQIATAPNAYDVEKLQNAGLSQAILLPNGVDLHFWRTDTGLADTISEEDGDFTFLAVGRLERQKGFEHLIRASSLLAHTLPAAFRVVIVGEGSEKAKLCELIRSQHVEDIVTLVGRKSPEKVRALFSETDAAVFPSLYETTPVTVLEAWAAGVPVIVSSVGILRDAPVDFSAAYVVQPADEDELADAMSNCITNAEARETVAAKGYAEVSQYDWPRVAQAAETIYRSVV
jgi:glycosyltransferase involved in cell wall biosynthesis